MERDTVSDSPVVWVERCADGLLYCQRDEVMEDADYFVLEGDPFPDIKQGEKRAYHLVPVEPQR